MSTVFSAILDMSLHGSVLIAAVMLFRLLFRCAPKALTVAAWAMAAVRLLCPFALTSAFSLMPFVGGAGEIGTDTLSLIITQENLPSMSPSASSGWSWPGVLAAVWGIGVLVMLVYTLVAFYRTRQMLREAVPMRDGVYECDRIPTPFIFGVLRARIYVPSSMSEQDRRYVIAHEQAHLARLDHIWKPLGFAVLALHWFNPLVWLGYVLFCRDMEMACDERVLTTLGQDSKKPYADALINCAAPTSRIAACPLAFGETDVKTRVRLVLRYQKPAWWLSATAIAVCLLLCVCFLTDPKAEALAVPQPNVPEEAVPSAPTAPADPTQDDPSLLSYTQAMTIEAITPCTVRVGDAVTVRVAVEDSRGVTDNVEVLLYRESEDGEYITVSDAVILTRVQGTATNGVYEGTIVVSDGTPAGDYRLRAMYIPVSVKPAVCTAYTPEGEAAVTVTE